MTRKQFIEEFTQLRSKCATGTLAEQAAAVADAKEDAIRMWRRFRRTFSKVPPGWLCKLRKEKP